MANPDSGIPDASIADTPCDFCRKRPPFLCNGRHAGHVGLSTTADPPHGGRISTAQKPANRTTKSVAIGFPLAQNHLGRTFAALDPERSGKSVNDASPRHHELGLLADLLRSSTGARADALSHSLLQRYGSLAALLFDIRHQKKLKVELPEAATERILDLSDLLLRACAIEVNQGQILSSSQALRRYLQLDMAGCARECFRVLFLDAANRLLLDQIMWEGTINCVQAHPREIVRLALINDATAVILAHNHPSGRMHPSADDHLMTQNIVAACNTLDIKVHDHLIITRSGVLSMMKR